MDTLADKIATYLVGILSIILVYGTTVLIMMGLNVLFSIRMETKDLLLLVAMVNTTVWAPYVGKAITKG